ncbi:MAG: tyrosine-type recombinase/integrase [Acidiferrobacterales bacterium]|nr:tyrosine-type recombinase/integrase [Acidiferrobacterales bacterium]
MSTSTQYAPWNKGKLIGQKLPLKTKEIWRIRTCLEMKGQVRDLAMFNLAIDSKLRGCDLMKLRVSDVKHGQAMQTRAIVMQQKTHHPVQLEIGKQARESVEAWIQQKRLSSQDYLFGSHVKKQEPLSCRQYARIVDHWVKLAGLNPAEYGTHSMRRTKPTIIYRKTHNLRAVQILLGHTKLESTVRYLGIETDDALEISENIQI